MSAEHGLTPAERALLFMACADHAVARCQVCDRRYKRTQIGADLLASRTHLCPMCGIDLTASIREHLLSCSAAAGCALILSACARAADTPAQALAHERWARCRAPFTQLERVDRRATPDTPHGAIFHFALPVERSRLPGDMAPRSLRRSS
jgi:hypothetical protein